MGQTSILVSHNVIVTACDDNYALYAGVMLASLKSSINKQETYEIYVLDDGITHTHKEKIRLLSEPDFHINFVDISSYFNSDDVNIFKTCSHFTKASYARLFIPELFKTVEKVLYLDADMIVCGNVGDIFKIKFDKELLAACIDFEAVKQYQHDKDFQEYIDKKLILKDGNRYFNSGVMLFNIEELIAYDFTNKCLAELRQIDSPKYVDQCILNKVLEGKVKFLESKWNFPCFVFQDNDRKLNEFERSIREQILADQKYPGILHFCGFHKPWSDVDNKFTEFFWKYARMTPFYEEILFKCVQNIITTNSKNNSMIYLKKKQHGLFSHIEKKIRYYRYKILSEMTYGKTRARYAQKKKGLKFKLDHELVEILPGRLPKQP